MLASKSKEKKTSPKSKKERDFERIRWLWFAGAAGGMITYFFASGLVSIDFGEDDGRDEKDGEVVEEVIVVLRDDEDEDTGL